MKGVFWFLCPHTHSQKQIISPSAARVLLVLQVEGRDEMRHHWRLQHVAQTHALRSHNKLLIMHPSTKASQANQLTPPSRSSLQLLTEPFPPSCTFQSFFRCLRLSPLPSCHSSFFSKWTSRVWPYRQTLWPNHSRQIIHQVFYMLCHGFAPFHMSAECRISLF